MNVFRGFLSVVIALVLFAVSYGQDCQNGQCARPSLPVARSIVSGPVTVVRSTGTVVRRVAAAPKKLFAKRPVRRVLSAFCCKN